MSNMSEQTTNLRPRGDSQHLSWLERGVVVWNQMRRDGPFTPDLRGFDVDSKLRESLALSDFQGVDLTGINMHGARLQGASFQRCILDGSDFRSADLTGSSLRYASIVGANFDGANLTNAKMAYAKCMRTRFSYGLLRNAILFDEGDTSFTPEFASVSEEVSGVQELLIELKRLHERLMDRLRYKFIGAPRMFYRGHAVQSWSLIPTVLRHPERDRRDVESEMLTEFISNNPNEFAPDMSLLSQLMKAREYGLPTRLLDVSSDPLVALFFAVENPKHDQSDATLHLFAVPSWLMQPFNSDSVAVVCAYARLRDRDQRLLVGDVDSKNLWDAHMDVITGNTRFRWNEVMDRIVGEITKEGRGFSERIDPYDFFRVFVVVPKIDERRLRTQSGAFLLSAFHESFEPEDVLARMPNVPLYDHYKLTISAAAKPAIREELERLNITRESLLSSLEVSAESIRARYGFE